MHGRIKVKTTAQQEAERAKEREKKIKIFRTAMNRIFHKREQNEFDDEALELTAKVLGSNPDLYAVWNFRKEILLSKKEESSSDEMQKLLLDELPFLVNCLHVNPKSYSVWLHRRFVMTNLPSPDWTNEVKLCSLFLTHDERNFHCWDYRRFVISKANVPLEEEFQFTSKKIFDNFSNYSAWHNRSMLLPKVYPVKESAGQVHGSALAKEFELVQNAFFTDPYDQSAWFYHRWLLGREERRYDLVYFSADFIEQQVIITATFSDPVKLSNSNLAHVILNGVPCSGVWKSASPSPGHSFVWTVTSIIDESLKDNNVNVELLVEDLGIKYQLLKLPESKSVSYDWSSQFEGKLLEKRDLPAVGRSVLQAELESCRLLLEEEAGNKWTLLTTVFLLRALDQVQHAEEAEAYLTELVKVDPYRKGYYEDLKSKYRLERHLEETRRSKGSLKNVNLENQELTTMYYCQFLSSCTSLNLSNNKLKRPGIVYPLLNIEVLNLDGNRITNLHNLSHAVTLKELSLRNNNISSADDLIPLQQLKNLQSLWLVGNPVCNVNNYNDVIRHMLPQVVHLDGSTI